MPIKYNQAGYDAVLNLRGEELWFIQVVRGVSEPHDINLGAIAELIHKVKSMMTIVKIEVAFVVPTTLAREFKGIGRIPGWKQFVKATEGLPQLESQWPKTPDQIAETVKTFMMET